MQENHQDRMVFQSISAVRFNTVRKAVAKPASQHR
jgi:hypothetical protein